MELPHIITYDTSLFEAITEIVKHEYVLVRDGTNKISGIVTTSDLSGEFASANRAVYASRRN